MKFINLPITLTAGILNAESDWIRYGLPAVLLTAIFFAAMRFDAAKIESPPVQPPAAARKVTPSATNLFSASPIVHGDGQKPPVDNLSEEQIEGRRTLCNAVGYALSKITRHRNTKALRMAIELYRGQGGPEAANRAVTDAVSDYNLGRWREEQCPAGSAHLPKGAIGEVLR